MHSFDPPYAHNDIKPGNVLITHRKGQPPLAILMDFGSARPARRQIRSRTEALQLQVYIFLNQSLFSTYTFVFSGINAKFFSMLNACLQADVSLVH